MNRVKILRIVTVFFIVLMLKGLAHSAGLPGEYLLSERWRTFFANVSPLHNPANLAEHTNISLRGVITLSPFDAAKLFETGLTVPMGLYHTAGVTLAGESGKPIESWIPEGNGFLPIDTVKSNSNLLFMASYAVNPLGRLLTGINLNYNYQSNFGFDPDYGIGFDVGILYRLLLHPVLGYHNIGLTYRNIPFFRIGNANRVVYSPLLKTSYHVSLLQGKVEFDLAYNLKDFTARSGIFSNGNKISEWDLMTNWSVKPLTGIGLKGYLEFYDDINRHSGFSLRSWGIAVLIEAPYFNRGNDFKTIYQYNNELSAHIHNSHSAYFKYDVGPSREESYSRRMSRLANISPSELYNRAMRLYYRGRYWDAYFIYMQILTVYPDFQVNDLVSYYAASSLEHLQMYGEAITLYNTTKSQYPRSRIIPNTDLGLMRIHYTTTNFSAVRNQYIELNKPNVPDSLRGHGAYLMGQTAMVNQDHINAIREFALVKEEHPDYIFATHSQAVAHATVNSSKTLVIRSLEKAIAAGAHNDAQREIVNRSFLLAGYLFFENQNYAKAITALRNVNTRSHYYPEALLGMAWTALKASQLHDCITAAQRISSATGDIAMQAEAALLEGYVLLAKREYSEAVNVLYNAYEELSNYNLIGADSISASKKVYDTNRKSHAQLATTVVSIAERGPYVDINATEQFRKKHLELIGTFPEYHDFMDRYKRTRFFARNSRQIREDIEFLLARAKRFSGSGREVERKMQQERQIDLELNRLRKEMEHVVD